MKSLTQIQEELKPWVKHNFGDRPAWHPLLGIGEEVGELNHHYLKFVQGIRNNENHREGIIDAVGDIGVYLLDFCNVAEINFEQVMNQVWDKVSKRDWKKSNGIIKSNE